MNKILTNIKYGWCNFNLGDYYGRPSYIRDLPMNILDAYEEYQKYNHCIVEFDEELTQFCLVLWENTVTILNNKSDNKRNCISLDFNAKEVLNELVFEIVNDIHTWAEWNAISNTDEYIKLEEKRIRKRVNELNLSPIEDYKVEIK